MHLKTQKIIDKLFSPDSETKLAAFTSRPEWSQRGQTRSKARRQARKPRNIITSVDFHSDGCQCAVDALEASPLRILKVQRDEPDEMPLDRTGYLMELDPVAKDWENDARVLMTHRVKFTVRARSSLAGLKMESLMTQLNYLYELSSDKRTAFFHP
jgi:hypothetical protein